jgi:hypothetical protein
MEINAGVSMIIIDQMNDPLPISSIPLRHSNIPGGAAELFHQTVFDINSNWRCDIVNVWNCA